MAKQYRLEKLMQEHHVTLEKLQADTGIRIRTILSIKKNRSENPHLKTLEILAGYFNVSVSYLIGEGEEDTEGQRVA